MKRLLACVAAAVIGMLSIAPLPAQASHPAGVRHLTAVREHRIMQRDGLSRHARTRLVRDGIWWNEPGAGARGVCFDMMNTPGTAVRFRAGHDGRVQPLDFLWVCTDGVSGPYHVAYFNGGLHMQVPRAKHMPTWAPTRFSDVGTLERTTYMLKGYCMNVIESESDHTTTWAVCANGDSQQALITS